MKRKTAYLNTDLDLASAQSLEALAGAFRSQGVLSLHVEQRNDGRWFATLETEEQFSEPEPNIIAFLNVIEAFAGSLREFWLACDVRAFNLGYDCGDEPWAFNHRLAAVTLARMAALGVSFRITFYPAGQPDQAGRASLPAASDA